MEMKQYQGFLDGSNSENAWDGTPGAVEYTCSMDEENGTSSDILMDIVKISCAPNVSSGYKESTGGNVNQPLLGLSPDQQSIVLPLLNNSVTAGKLEMDSKELSKTVAESMGLYMNAARELDYGFGPQSSQGGGHGSSRKRFHSFAQNLEDNQGSSKSKPLDLSSTCYTPVSHPAGIPIMDCSSGVTEGSDALVSSLSGTQNFNSSLSSPASSNLVSSTTSLTDFGNAGLSLNSPIQQAPGTASAALVHRPRMSGACSPTSTRDVGSPLASPPSVMRSPISSPQSMSSVRSPPSCSASVRSSVSSPTGQNSNMQASVSSPGTVNTMGGICSPDGTEQEFKTFEFPKVEKLDGESYSIGLDQLGMVKYIKNERNTDSSTMCLSTSKLNRPGSPFSMQIKSEPNKAIACVNPHYSRQQYSLNPIPPSETTYLSLRNNTDEYSLFGILGPPASSLNSNCQQEAFPDGGLPERIKQESEDGYSQENNGLPTSAIVGVNSGGHSFHYEIGARGTMSFTQCGERDQTDSLPSLISPATTLMETWKSHSALGQSRRDVYPGQRCIAEVSSSLRTQSSGTSATKVCLVCGDEASGCHYGVITCGSCKVFFKRAIEGQHNYLCAGRNDCIIDKIRRKNCPACRVRKCLQAGMNLGARKSKKLGKLKGVAEPPLPSPKEGNTCLDSEKELSVSTALVAHVPGMMPYLSPSMCSVLELIEPEVVYAGYDNTQPDTTDHLLSSLNQLAGKQMIRVVKWAKVLPGFRNLPIEDQITLIQYSWMCLSSFALSWRSYKHTNGQMLYFAPDLVFNEARMQQSAMYDLCVGMRQVSQEFVRLQLTHEEFLVMKVLLLLSTVPKDGLRNQAAFDEMRANYIKELRRCIAKVTSNSGHTWSRFYQLTKLLDAMHDLVGNLLDFCFYTFRESQALKVEFPEMLVEIISDQIPKVESGLTHTLYFHKK
uniref:Nuclear receptor subfamily 3 group C member 2 n=1 Tax=Scleropages formosus TaxID=113540 RepID=A0A8C9VBQ7_SCLFO